MLPGRDGSNKPKVQTGGGGGSDPILDMYSVFLQSKKSGETRLPYSPLINKENARIKEKTARDAAFAKEVNINTAKYVTGVLGAKGWMHGTAVDIAKTEKPKLINRAAAYDRVVLKQYGKYATRAGRFVTGLDLALTTAQYLNSKGDYRATVQFTVNIGIGLIGLSKDPVNSTASLILGLVENAGRFDWVYSGAAQY